MWVLKMFFNFFFQLLIIAANAICAVESYYLQQTQLTVAFFVVFKFLTEKFIEEDRYLFLLVSIQQRKVRRGKRKKKNSG